MNLPTTKIPNIQVGTTISADLWQLAKQHNVNWSDALKLGVQIQLAEKGVGEYPQTIMKKKFNKIRELYEAELKKENKK